MSILINKDTKVITQGITGKTGQFHTRACREYANGREAECSRPRRCCATHAPPFVILVNALGGLAYALPAAAATTF